MRISLLPVITTTLVWPCGSTPKTGSATCNGLQSKTGGLAFMSPFGLTLFAPIRSRWLRLAATQLTVFATSSNC
ncbi:hypothetical protein ELQ88_00185 (plasmid) [Pseudomonas sp. MPC6]|nr:hypothetical protein ELQ88_00185 [Pseudomonas sp. MPC6]